jgi:hypothetical protein
MMMMLMMLLEEELVGFPNRFRKTKRKGPKFSFHP